LRFWDGKMECVREVGGVGIGGGGSGAGVGRRGVKVVGVLGCERGAAIILAAVDAELGDGRR
jgi:hypothetical protein